MSQHPSNSYMHKQASFDNSSGEYMLVANFLPRRRHYQYQYCHLGNILSPIIHQTSIINIIHKDGVSEKRVVSITLITGLDWAHHFTTIIRDGQCIFDFCMFLTSIIISLASAQVYRSSKEGKAKRSEVIISLISISSIRLPSGLLIHCSISQSAI